MYCRCVRVGGCQCVGVGVGVSVCVGGHGSVTVGRVGWVGRVGLNRISLPSLLLLSNRCGGA